MPACEWCWSRAYMREMGDTSKSQAEHYTDLLAEQDAKGGDADCPVMQEEWKLRGHETSGS